MRHGRTFPIKPHLAGPIVGPPAPPVVISLRGIFTRQAGNMANQARHRKPPRALLARPLVGAQAVFLPPPAFIVRAPVAARRLRSRIQKPRYASPLVTVSLSTGSAAKTLGPATAEAVGQTWLRGDWHFQRLNLRDSS